MIGRVKEIFQRGASAFEVEIDEILYIHPF